MENTRYLKYKQENDLLILQLTIDEYRELQNALQLLNKKRITAKNYYYKSKEKISSNRVNKILLLLLTIEIK